MLTPSKRAACQRYFESKYSVESAEDLALFKDDLRAYRLTLFDEQSLSDCTDEDARASFERSAISLFQAVCDLQAGDRMWSAVKLYYSVFYALRSEILLEGFSTIRAGRVLIFDCKQGRLCRQYNGSASGDHGMAIALAKRYFKDSDLIQTQTISGEQPYEWLKGVRETVQYRMRKAPELENYDPFFPDDQWSIEEQMKTFLADKDGYYCFDPDYAALALPLKRFELTSKRIKRRNVSLSADFFKYAETYFVAGKASRLLKPYI